MDVKEALNPTDLKQALTKALETASPIIPRTAVPGLTGGLISKGRLQNLDSEGRGPRKITIGRKVAYLREDLIDWLVSRAKV